MKKILPPTVFRSYFYHYQRILPPLFFRDDGDTKILMYSILKRSTPTHPPTLIFHDDDESEIRIVQYIFTSFLSRDEAFKLINDGWVEHGMEVDHHHQLLV
ncbi:hypothetical protein Hdeb2414_s0020g00554271 [Helianthus debilis subsp. tardiflorus]